MPLKSTILMQQLVKTYGHGEAQIKALDGIDLEVYENEFVAIMGPSGSGKSTLMNIIGCLDRPTAGSYLLAEEDISKYNKNQLALIRNKHIGFVFQSYNLLPNVSALENVILPLIYSREPSMDRASMVQKARTCLESVGLGDRLHHTPQELSGGQAQRVAIARALVNDPMLILADEPTGNLDSRSGLEIMDILKDLNLHGRTILLVTHDEKIASYAHRIIHLKDGKIEKDVPNGSNSLSEEVKDARR